MNWSRRRFLSTAARRMAFGLLAAGWLELKVERKTFSLAEVAPQDAPAGQVSTFLYSFSYTYQ